MLGPNAEPGTGTQTAVLAERGETMTINGRKWHVGADYWDSQIRDVAELVAIVGKSSWCDTNDPEDAQPMLIFEAETMRGQNAVRTGWPDGRLDDRFTKRREPDRVNARRL